MVRSVKTFKIDSINPGGLNKLLENSSKEARICTSNDKNLSTIKIASTEKLENLAAGEQVSLNSNVIVEKEFIFKERVIEIMNGWMDAVYPDKITEKNIDKTETRSKKDLGKERLDVGSKDLKQLGIIEYEDFRDKDKYPSIKGRGMTAEALAILEMICRYLKLPFRKELAKKYFKDQEKKGKKISIESLGGIAESLGCQTQIGSVKVEHLNSVDYPAIEVNDGHARIYWEVENKQLITSDPRKGIQRIDLDSLDKETPIKILLLKRSIEATTVKFGWSWFLPLVNKYKFALILVFAATLLAQLMNLAIPLMLQQIIDKVLNQGNISTLNVLGGTMIVLALFSGILTALRQFIFVDTTDRMDLTLGSAVIDRLLSLPLRYFERRPVGELSQRLGELNSIRGFLTGTALISTMNIFFALMYLVVMIILCPLLTGVALSTFNISPIGDNNFADIQANDKKASGGISKNSITLNRDTYRHSNSQSSKLTINGKMEVAR